MIEKEISKKVLTIGPYRKDGKGGVAVVVNNLSPYYDPFFFISSTRSKNPLLMFSYFGASIARLLYYILIKRIKVVHIHGSFYGSFLRKKILINLSHLFDVKTIYHIHSGGFKQFYDKYNQKLNIKRTIDKADVLIVLSQRWKEYFSEITSSNKIIVLNNIIDKPITPKNKYTSENPMKILFLGLIGNNKGIYDLLDVIAQNKEAWRGKLILHVGGNGETEKLIKIIAEKQLQDIVRFEGWVNGEKKEELLSTSDIFILPSYNEGLPVSILEAMSYGLPIISTFVGGIPEVVEENRNGFLIEPGDKKALENKIEAFLENKSLIKTMGEANLEIIESYYPNAVIPVLNGIYRELIDEK